MEHRCNRQVSCTLVAVYRLIRLSWSTTLLRTRGAGPLNRTLAQQAVQACVSLSLNSTTVQQVYGLYAALHTYAHTLFTGQCET